MSESKDEDKYKNEALKREPPSAASGLCLSFLEMHLRVPLRTLSRLGRNPTVNKAKWK
jgi:hypothetical protein